MASSFTPTDGHATSSPHAGEPPSPEVPAYSPLSPVAPELPALPPLTQLPKQARPSYLAAAPAPEPIDTSSNPDAIALRAAISVLQVQRQRALGDLRTLETQRDAAAAHPEEFARALADGQVQMRPSTSVLGGGGGGGGEPEEEEDDEMSSSDEDMADADADGMTGKPKPKTQKKGKKAKKGADGANSDEDERARFDQIPAPQNIVRCPPINWAKYHVAGDVLDRLHQEQQARPDPGLLYRDPLNRPPEHQVAAPYSPWNDKLADGPAKGRAEARKG